MLHSLFNRGPQVPETTVSETVAARDAGTVQILDVREPDEWAAGHIPDAVHIPLGSLPTRTGELDQNLPVVVVCRSGVRSLSGADILLKAGFGDAKSMAGGMIDWAAAGQPVER
jgi:rhodanese-related sulfurtransferase